MQETPVRFLGQEDLLEKGQATHSSILGLPWCFSWERFHLQCRRPGLIPGLGRSPGAGKGYPLQYSGLENSLDYIVHGIAKSQTQLSDFHFHMSIELVMPSNHLILCHPLLHLALNLSQHQHLSSESALRIRWPKYQGFSFSHNPFNEYSGLISFRIDCFDLLAVQETLKSLLQRRKWQPTPWIVSNYIIFQ